MEQIISYAGISASFAAAAFLCLAAIFQIAFLLQVKQGRLDIDKAGFVFAHRCPRLLFAGLTLYVISCLIAVIIQDLTAVYRISMGSAGVLLLVNLHIFFVSPVTRKRNTYDYPHRTGGHYPD